MNELVSTRSDAVVASITSGAIASDAIADGRVQIDVAVVSGPRPEDRAGGIAVARLSAPFAAAKRAIDVLLAGVALIVLAPLMLLVAAAVRATSPGPVIFRQTRTGRGGRPFTLFKFRSMVDRAETLRDALAPLNEASGPVFKLRNDPRTTPVGRVLRRLSLDELPQLWNVLRGDMSLVGPRPPLPKEVQCYSQRQLGRLAVKPGITCIWQVSGRSDVPFDQWMEMDLDYIERMSLWLDAQILLQTVPAVLRAQGAR